MDLRVLRTVFLLVGISILLSCASKKQTLPYYVTPDFTPHWQMPEKDSAHEVSDFSRFE